MALLSFKVQTDYEKVVKLREEIAKLETQLKSFGKNSPQVEIKAVETRLAEARKEFTAVASEAAKAGAVLSTDFKGRIRESTAVVDGLTAKIIEQKTVIKDVEHDVKRLGEAYRVALKGKNSSKISETKGEFDAAKRALDEEKAALFALNQEKAKASLQTKKLKDEYAEFKEQAGEAKRESESFTMSLGKIAGLVGGVTALKSLVSQIVAVRAQFQDMETQIETLVGADVTARIMPQIKEMAKVSPLTMGDIVGAEKMMLSFNIEAEKSVEFLRALSDVSMGNSQKFNSLTLAFSQMSSAGRLMGQDLLQMINAGFNPLQQISEKTGKSIAQLKEEMSKGAISAEMVQQAFLDATSAGGKFYNMSENASKTINGQISMMQDAMDAMFNELGTKTEGVIIKSIQTATALIQNYEKIGQVLASLVGTYGVYRTAVFLATAATSKHTIAEVALINVRIAARKAQLALNAAMLTNPYVALATVIAGLTAAIVANADAMSANARAHREYNERLEEANKTEEDRKQKVRESIDAARDEAEATGRRVEALEFLQKQYPSIFNQYDLEKVKLADIASLKKEIAELDRQSAVASKKERLAELDKELDKAAARVNTHGGGLLGKFASSANKKGYEALVGERDALREEIIGDAIADYIAKLPEEKKQLEELKDAFQKRIDNSESFVLDGFELSDAHMKRINNAILKKIKAPTYSEEYNEAKTEWEKAKAKLDEVKKDKEKYTTKQYEEYKAEADKWEKKFKALGGDTTGKAAKADTAGVKKYNEQLAQKEKVERTERKSNEERARSVKDMEFTIEQARIDAMKEGAEKRRAQRELDNKKELEDLGRKKQDYINKVVEQERAIFDAQEEQKAKSDDKYKKQAFDTEAATKRAETTDPVVKQYTEVIKLTERRQNQEATKEDMDAWRDSMNTYLREYGDYEGKKLAITQEYERKIAEASNIWDKAALTQKMKEELAALDIETNKSTNAIAQLFGDMRDKSVAQLDGISEKGTEALEFLKSGAWDETKGKELGITKETFDIWSKSPEKLRAIAEALEGVRTTAEKLRNPLDKIAEGFKDLFKSAGDKNKFEAAFASINEGVSEMMDAVEFISDSLSSMGEATGTEWMTEAAKGINSALNVAGGAMSGAQAGAAFGPWGAAIGAAVGLASSLVTELSKAKDAAHDVEIDRLAKETETLDKSYESLGKNIEKAFSVDASNLIAQQNTLLEQKKANLKLMIAEEEAKKNVDESQVEAWKQQIDEIDATIEDNKDAAINAVAGQDVMSAIDSFASAYAEAWAKGEDAATASTKAVRNMLRNSLTEYLRGQLSDEVEAFNKKLAEVMADGIIEPWEQEQLDKIREELDTEAENYYNQTSDYWKDEDEISQQAATRRGYETLSEDTGNELVGRATAQYESNLRMEAAMRETKEIADIMAAGQTQIRDIAAESRALIADSYLELQQIRENTGAIIKPIKNLSEKIDSWNPKIMSL